MADASEVAQAQEFFTELDEYSLQQDSIFGLVKRQDVEATLAAADSGKFSDYWTVEKLADLNDVVDTAKNCPEDLKNIFSGSKNPRIRAMKIGGLLLKHTLDVRSKGGVASKPAPSPGKSAEAQSAAKPTPASPSRDASSSGAARPSGVKTTSSRRSARPQSASTSKMQRYIMSDDLPEGCQLRVRAAPDPAAAELLVVTRDDEIYASERRGDWLRVELPGSGLEGDAWMMCSMGENGQTLLVPADEPPISTRNPSVPQPVPGAGGNTSFSDFDPLSHGNMGGVSASMDPPMHGRTSPFRQPDNSMSMRSSYPAASASSPRRGFSYGGGDLNDTARSHQSAVPSVVSYAAYQMLEMRVSRLEQELGSLLDKLRSV